MNGEQAPRGARSPLWVELIFFLGPVGGCIYWGTIMCSLVKLAVTLLIGGGILIDFFTYCTFKG